MIKQLAALFPGIAMMYVVPATAAATKAGGAAKAAKPHTVTKSAGHPGKHAGAVAAHTTKPKPAPKAEKAPKATAVATIWIPGDYYWDGGDWQWDEGYFVDQPFTDALWVNGHWSDRTWGWTWVPGYWL